jgi:RES domain-containing protein
LQGKREMAGVVLYAGLFEPDVVRFDLWNLPASHRQGPTFMNVLRVLDLPQALALAAPKKVRLYVQNDEEMKRWDWTMNLQKQLGGDSVQIRKVPAN